MSTTENRPLLLTGATGFLGSILLTTLRAQGNHVVTVGRSGLNDIVCDLSLSVPVPKKPPAIVVHNAGRAHVVPRTTEEGNQFFKVNAAGTANLLKGLQQCPRLPESIVYISSVSVYGLTRGKNIREDRRLSSRDPYGLSKIKAENLLLSWCEEHKVPLTILRPPLIAGPNPPGNLGAMIAGIRKGYYFNIAGGTARKSMVMASDLAAIIPAAAANPGIYHLTDGHHPSFKELGDCIAKQLGVRPPRNISGVVANALGAAGSALDLIAPGKSPISRATIAKLTSTLTFDDTKARNNLGWNPGRVIDALRLH